MVANNQVFRFLSLTSVVGPDYTNAQETAFGTGGEVKFYAIDDPFENVNGAQQLSISPVSYTYDLAVINTTQDLTPYGPPPIPPYFIIGGGYPVDLEGHPGPAGAPLYSAESNVTASAGLLTYDDGTFAPNPLYPTSPVAPGMSGGPVLTNGPGGLEVAGVISTTGWAVGLTPDNWNTVENWENMSVVVADFNDDGNSDLLWQNADGQPAIWLTNGTTPTAETFAGGNPGPSWHTVGTGDFYDNGYADILWQNTNGTAYIWEMNGTNVVGGGSIGNPGPSWHAVATGDFYDNGGSDILWQNSNGAVVIWEMNGTSIVGGGSLGNPGPSWHAIGTGDFYDNGYSDILWQNSSGEAYIWEMNGTSVVGGGSLGNPGPTWHAVGTGDFYDNGYSDVLWQNDSGEVYIWEMNGTNVVGGGSVGNPGPSWHVIGTGDYYGNGYSDILFQNSSGATAIWEMTGTNVVGGGSVGNPGPSWHVEGDSSPYAAAKADLLWQSDGSDVLLQNDSGEAFLWASNGSAVTGGRKPRQSRAELARQDRGRLQWRRQSRPVVAER